MKSLEVSFRLALWKEEHCQANQSALRWTNQMLRHDVSHLRAKLEACGTTSPLDSVGSFPVPSAERCAQRCCAGGAERAEAGRNVTVAGEEVWLSEEEEERLVPAAPHVEDCESLARDVRLALVAQRLEEREREKVRRERAREGEGRGDTESEVAGPVQEEERQLRKEEQARLIRQEGRERSLEHEEEERQLEQEEQARSLEHEALRRQVEERMRSGWGEPGGGGGGRMDGSSTGRAAHGRQQEDCSRAVPALGESFGSGADEGNLVMTRRAQRDIWVQQHPTDCAHPSVKFLVVDVLRKVRGRFLGVGAQVNWLAGVLGTAHVDRCP
ncbi:hypothetical protein CLOM_g16417 [Closterium sp. NIES-68]|nr:hypothetical protein CLOM_g16417 [Closterium sp. NIES-68]